MSAPDLSAEERATVERFEAAEAAEESLRERVARAMAIDLAKSQRHDDPERYFELYADLYRTYADSAIAVMRGQS